MKVICKLSEEAKVPGEDWDSLMWHNGKLFSGGYANGKIKDFCSLGVESGLETFKEFDAHEYPIYHMTPGSGSTFFTSSSDCTIRHWDEAANGSFNLLATLEGHEEPPRKLRFFNGRLYSGDEKGYVKVWEDGKCLGTIETMEEIWDLLAIQDHFITVRHIDVTVYSITQRDDKLRGSVRTSIPGRAPLLTVGDRLCCIDRKDNVVNVHELNKPGTALLGSLKGHEALINAIVVVSNLLVTGSSDKNLIVWNLENFSQEGKISVDGYVNAVVSTPDGTVYAAGENKFIACIKL
ncbi:Myosin heavy chain kinase B [Orchesella cincta]|uniref:Myosin heavy chain kinase B n=1 Tax=Orchesella cincta TaxID=48709 RepID=A0A1D2NFX0_ORCCI|nr:Myosin heavy chain kinase B [Orchesella cincta]